MNSFALQLCCLICMIINFIQATNDYPLIRLPRIDLLKYTNGTHKEKMEIVSAFKQHLHQYGTLSLYNHGIPHELIDNLRAAGYNFHRQDEEYKLQFASDGVGTPGFDKFKSLAAAYSYGKSEDMTGDFCEMFAFFNHISGTDEFDTYLPKQEDAPSELAAITREYIPHIRRVLDTVHSIASEALMGMGNVNYLESMYARSPHLQLRSFYYPSTNVSDGYGNDDIDGKYRVSEHKDYMAFTLFHPGNERGLQNKIGGSDGVWVDCQTDGEVEYDIFLNTGELFDVWTNGYWLANWHRVIMNARERVTFSYFSGPDNDQMVEPIEGRENVCTQEEAKYAPRTAAQHAQMRFSKGDLQNPNGKKFFSE